MAAGAFERAARDLVVTEVRAHAIAIADPPLFSSYGLHAPYALRTIVEVVADGPFVGIAETPGGEAMARAVDQAGKALIGRDVFDYARALPSRVPGVPGDASQTMMVPGENPVDEPQRIRAALEIACLDIQGQALRRPLCDVVGGRLRDQVEFSAYLFYKRPGGGGLEEDARQDRFGAAPDADAIVQQARAMVAEYGFSALKLKGGVLEPQLEIETLVALREAFPDAPLRIDPNCAWTSGTALEVARATRELLGSDGYLEDPVAGLDGMAELRRALLSEGGDVRLASNVSVTNLRTAHEAATRDAVQVVLSDPHYWGGIREQQVLGSLCESLGMGLSMHSNSHLGVSLMTMVHAAAVSPGLTDACDTHYPWQHGADEVVEHGRIAFEHGSVQVPDTPGLGVRLDLDQLERLKERYRQIPYRERDDELEMRAHVDPTWRRTIPRW